MTQTISSGTAPGQPTHGSAHPMLPGDPGYDKARVPWNVSVDQRPAAVVTVTEPAQVGAAIRAAREAGESVTAQPRGHGATAALAGDALKGTVLLRTSGLTEITIDADRRVARVGAGVRWGELLAALDGTGLIALVGSNPDVSVVGYLLGGGLSWFGRKYGPASRSIRALEVVDAQGVEARVTPDSDADLFWALRGGGGEFGIVTAVEIELYDEPLITGGMIMFPGEEAPAVLAAVAELTAVAPRELTLWAGVLHMPPAPHIPEHMRGKTFTVVDAVYLGDEQRCNALLWTIREAGTVVRDTVASITIGQVGAVAEEPVDPMPSMDCGLVLRRIDPSVIERVLRVAGAGSGTALTTVMIRHVDGALAHRSPEDGVAGPIEGSYLLFALGVPMGPGRGSAIEADFAALRSELAADCAPRVPFNFLGHEGIAGAYPAQDVERLRDIKRARDPENVIRGNRPLF